MAHTQWRRHFQQSFADCKSCRGVGAALVWMLYVFVLGSSASAMTSCRRGPRQGTAGCQLANSLITRSVHIQRALNSSSSLCLLRLRMYLHLSFTSAVYAIARKHRCTHTRSSAGWASETVSPGGPALVSVLLKYPEEAAVGAVLHEWNLAVRAWPDDGQGLSAPHPGAPGLVRIPQSPVTVQHTGWRGRP